MAVLIVTLLRSEYSVHGGGRIDPIHSLKNVGQWIDFQRKNMKLMFLDLTLILESYGELAMQ